MRSSGESVSFKRMVRGGELDGELGGMEAGYVNRAEEGTNAEVLEHAAQA